MIKIWIDGKEIETEEGRTILEVARREGIYIPTLCFHEALLPIGSCRLCIVEVEGFARPQTSCTTYVSDGMRVRTKSDRLLEMRREFLKFILMEHPLDCPQCDKAGSCRLQDLVYEHEIEEAPYRFHTEKAKIEPFSTPLIRKWGKRCVACLRCYHACRQVAGRKVLEIAGTGFGARIAVADAEDCISCGECLEVCPVGALTEALSPVKTRPWMARQVETVCPHCGFGCTLLLDVQDGFVAKARGSLCVRGRFGYDFVNQEGRIEGPYLRIYDEKRALTVEEAQTYVLSRLKSVTEEGGSIGFLVSPRVTNEEAYLLRELARAFPRSVLSSSAYFHGSQVVKAFEEAGLPLHYSYEELMGFDLVLVWGCELLEDNHVFATKIREAVRKKGTRLVVVGAAPTPLTRIADIWLKIKPGTDHLLLARIAKEALDKGLCKGRVEQIDGFDGLKGRLEGVDGEVLRLCDVEESAFQRLMSGFREAKGVAILFGTALSASEACLRWLINACIVTGARPLAVLPQANALGVARLLREMVNPKDVLGDRDVKALLVYEEEPFAFMEEGWLKDALAQKRFVAVFSPFSTEISLYAHVCLPSATFVEKEGTFLAQNGSVRVLKKAREAPAAGIEFLKGMVLELKGKEISREEVRAGLDAIFREKVGAKRFLLADLPRIEKGRGFKARLEDVFKSPYLSFSKGIGLILEDRVFISTEDAQVLGVADGEEVVLENERARVQKKVWTLPGLKSGVVMVYPFRERDVLKLFEDVKRETELNLRKP